MSLIEKYELLKNEGSWTDCLNYILSLSNKTEIESYLKKSHHLYRMMTYKCWYAFLNRQRINQI